MNHLLKSHLCPAALAALLALSACATTGTASRQGTAQTATAGKAAA